MTNSPTVPTSNVVSILTSSPFRMVTVNGRVLKPGATTTNRQSQMEDPSKQSHPTYLPALSGLACRQLPPGRLRLTEIPSSAAHLPAQHVDCEAPGVTLHSKTHKHVHLSHAIFEPTPPRSNVR